MLKIKKMVLQPKKEQLFFLKHKKLNSYIKYIEGNYVAKQGKEGACLFTKNICIEWLSLNNFLEMEALIPFEYKNKIIN